MNYFLIPSEISIRVSVERRRSENGFNNQKKMFYSVGITKLLVRFAGTLKMITIALRYKPKVIVFSKDIITFYSILDLYTHRPTCRYTYAM
jgi:hypothetical protein